jgi:GR25 family glycosyltransferase involved in LPS biosynthesis
MDKLRKCWAVVCSFLHIQLYAAVTHASNLVNDQSLLQIKSYDAQVMLQLTAALEKKMPQAAETFSGLQPEDAYNATKISTSPLRTIVISLDSRRDRWSKILSQLAPLNKSDVLRIQRLKAAQPMGTKSSVDTEARSHTSNAIFSGVLEQQEADGFETLYGANFHESDVTKIWSTDTNSKHVPFSYFYAGNQLMLSKGERGCAMSHIQAWQEVVGGSKDSHAPTLILEDDAVLSLDFVHQLRSLLQRTALASNKPDMVYLGYEVAVPLKREVAPGIYEARYLWTTIAYLLWPSGARKLLQALPVNQPVDNFIAALVESGHIKALAVEPKLVHAWNSWDVNSDIAHSDEQTNFLLFRLRKILGLPLSLAMRGDWSSLPARVSYRSSLLCLLGFLLYKSHAWFSRPINRKGSDTV